jgi:hypothetical protein
VPLRQAADELLEQSDLLDGQLRMRLQAYRDGYDHGYEAGYSAGREDLAADMDAAWNAIARPISRINPGLIRRRWSVRGEPRDRAAFSEPHPHDYQGREGAA